jgi:translocation and assembly module TamB
MSRRQRIVLILRWSGIVLGTGLVLLAGLRIAAGSAPGRWALDAALDGRSIAGHTLAIDGIRGDPLSRFRIDRITFADNEGIWLTAEDITVDWRSRSAVFPPYHVERITVAHVTMHRPPASPARAVNSGGTPELPPLFLGEMNIAELALADGVLGQPARLRVEAAANVLADGRASGRFDLVRLDTPGDRLSAEFSLTGETVTGQLQANGQPDGPLANLLRLPDREIHADGQVAGDRQSGTGDIVLAANGETVARVQAQWTPVGWLAEGSAGLDRWDLLPEAYRNLAAQADFRAEGPRDPAPQLGRIRVHAAGGWIEAEPAGDTAWAVDAYAEADTIVALSRGEVAATGAHWSGQAARSDGTWQLDGQVDASGLATGLVTARRASGPVSLSRSNGIVRIETSLVLENAQTRRLPIDALLAERTGLAFDGSWLGRERILQVDRLAIDSGHAHLDATGRYPFGDPGPEITAEIAITDVSRLTGLASGPVRGSIAIAAQDVADVTLDARDAHWNTTASDLLSGLSGQARLARTQSGWRLADVSARSNGLDLSASGQLDGDDWSLEGDLAVSGRIPVEMLEIDSALATAFRAESSGDRIVLRTATTSDTFAAGPLQVSNPRLAVETVWADGALAADWLLEASRNAKPVRLSGTAAWTPGSWNIDLDDGRLSPFALSGSAASNDGRLDAALAVALGDRAEATLRLSAPAGAPLNGTLEARFHLTGHAFPGGHVNDAQLILAGPLRELEVALSADGRLRSPFDVTAQGRLALPEAGGLDLTLRPAGRWSIHDVVAPEPARLTVANGQARLDAAIVLGEGRVDLIYDDTGAAPTIDLAIDTLPVSAIGDIAALPPAAGTLSGNATLRRGDESWQGNATLSANDLVSLSVDDMAPLTLDTDLALTPQEARLETRLSGRGLTASGWLTRDGATRTLTRLAGADGSAISGRLDASGALAPIAALVLPSETVLHAGEVDAEVDLGGVRGSPVLAGQVRVGDGHLTAAAIGSTIRQIDLTARFDDNGIDLTSFSATDGRDGRVSGSGQLRLPTEGARGEARFQFERFLAVHRPDLTAQGTGHVELTLDGRGLLVAGQARIDQVRASPTLNGAASIPEIDVREVNLPKNRTAYSRTILPVRLDYGIEAERNIYVTSRSFSSEWGADLRVTGPTGKPNLAGTANLAGGTAFVLNRRFSLDDGEVRFDGTPADARIDLTASHARTGFSATANIAGPVRSPTVTLSSEPALPEDEILSRLLFDESVSELGAFEAAQLAAQLSGQSLLGVVGQLRDLAGIDRLDVSTDAAGNLAVTGGRRFGESVYVEVGSTGVSALSQALVEWQLTPDLSVLSRLSADTDAEIAIRWRRDY